MPRFSRDVPPDPSGISAPHDILAAEEFPPPAAPDADTPLARARRLPPDPSGISGPHDILAAEEFPPPAAADFSGSASAASRKTAARGVAIGAGVAGALLLLRRLRG